VNNNNVRPESDLDSTLDRTLEDELDNDTTVSMEEGLGPESDLDSTLEWTLEDELDNDITVSMEEGLEIQVDHELMPPECLAEAAVPLSVEQVTIRCLIFVTDI